MLEGETGEANSIHSSKMKQGPEALFLRLYSVAADERDVSERKSALEIVKCTRYSLVRGRVCVEGAEQEP